MASVVVRSRPRWASGICEACKGHVPATRSPASAPLRLFSVATRPASRGDPPYQRPKYRTSSSNVQQRLKRYQSTQTPSPATESPFITRAPPGLDVSPEAGCARLTHRRLIALSGPDTAKFLQGLITNNVDSSKKTPFYAAFLDARGRMLWDVFIWTYPGLQEQQGMAAGEWACYIEVDAAEVESLAKHLKRHKLRSKITIKVMQENGDLSNEDATENVQVWASWGSEKSIGESYQVISDIDDPRFISDRVTMRRSLVRPAQTTSLPQVADDAPLEIYHQLRHNYGVAEGQIEIPRESALPMEYNVDLSQGIDFKKGCYLGQELTIRTKHTGVVRKRILPVGLSNANANAPQADSNATHSQVKIDPTQFDSADIKQLLEDGGIKKGRAAGKLISACGNVGLALCRLEMMTSMKISAEGGTWMPGMEFGVADREGKVVKVKPFLRDEWVTRVRDIWDKKRTRI